MTATLALPQIRRLRLSPTLTGYIARTYWARLFTFLFGLVGVIFLVTLVDLLDRLATKEGISLGAILQMVLLKVPYLTQEVMPFTVLFAGLATFWRLTRTNELVVARAAGVSVWQFLLPVVSSAILVGVVTVTLLNPLGSILLGRFELLESRYHRTDGSLLSVSKTGLWLRQADAQGHLVIHAQRVLQSSMTLDDVIVFGFRDDDRFVSRMDAPRAELHDGFWRLYEVWSAAPGILPRYDEVVELPTDLTPEKIQESFAPPETISFWNLVGFIELLETAGFSAQRHKLQLHRLLATPVLFAAMILIAATFSLRPQRRGLVALVIATGILAGFVLYFLSNFVFALGLSAKIPVILAGWTPAGVSMLLGIATLLHLEDG